MDVKIQAVNFTADQKLINFVDGKVAKLNVFFDHIISCETFMKVDKSGTARNKITEIKLNLPGRELFAKKQCDSFEEATDSAVDALRRQLVKHKAKVVA